MVNSKRTRALSLDWIAVIAALGAVLLVKLGLVPHVGW
jgi:hypothetical protein